MSGISTENLKSEGVKNIFPGILGISWATCLFWLLTVLSSFWVYSYLAAETHLMPISWVIQSLNHLHLPLAGWISGIPEYIHGVLTPEWRSGLSWAIAGSAVIGASSWENHQGYNLLATVLSWCALEAEGSLWALRAPVSIIFSLFLASLLISFVQSTSDKEFSTVFYAPTSSRILISSLDFLWMPFVAPIIFGLKLVTSFSLQGDDDSEMRRFIYEAGRKAAQGSTEEEREFGRTLLLVIALLTPTTDNFERRKVTQQIRFSVNRSYGARRMK